MVLLSVFISEVVYNVVYVLIKNRHAVGKLCVKGKVTSVDTLVGVYTGAVCRTAIGVVIHILEPLPTNAVTAFKKLENKVLPEDIDYFTIDGLRIEAQQKLDEIRPASIGQASRISGVSPADISVLLVYLKQN